MKVNLVAEAAGYVRGMDEAAKKTRETGSEAQKLAQKAQGFQALGKAGVAVGVAIVGIGAAAMKTGIEYNTLQQTTRAALKTLLGSAEAANAQMDKLDAFARTSPFAKQVFITAQQQLLGFGMAAERVVPTLDAIQNAVAATGGSNEDIAELVRIIAQLEGGVKISAETFNQFGGRGIDAAQLIGDAMGKTGQQIRSEVTEGTLDADAAIKALVDGMATRFAGASANVKETFAGAMDRVKAAWRDFSAELARPLVNPDGGGALVDLLNWGADMMRMFQGLPEPVKTATATLVGIIGVVSLLGGTALIALPKIVAFNASLAAIGITGPVVMGKLQALTSFMTGPWGIALLAAGISVKVFSDYLEGIQADAEELDNALKTASNSATIFTTNMQGHDEWWQTLGQAKNELEDLDAVLETAARQATNWWERIGNSSNFASERALERIGDQLGTLARTDLPLAQNRFRMLAEETDGTDRRLWQLLSTMPEYRDALIAQATAQDIAISEMDEAERKQTLLTLAQGEGKHAVEGVAGATEDLAKKAEAAADAIEAQQKAHEKWLESVADSSASFINILGAYDSIIDKNKEVATSTASATESSKDSWEDYYDGFSVSLDQYLADLEKQVAAQDNWQQNMVLLSGKVSRGVIDELATLGPEGAPLIADLVNASDEELARFEEVFSHRSGEASAAFANTLDEAGPVIAAAGAQLGEGAANEIATKLRAGTHTVEQIVAEYKLKVEGMRPVVQVDTSVAESHLQGLFTRWSHKQIPMRALIDADEYHARARGSADGGAIGYASGGAVAGFGGPRQDNIPAWLSSGEHVLSVKDVQAMGGQTSVYRWRESLHSNDHMALSKTVAAPQQYAYAPSPSGSGSGRSVTLQNTIYAPQDMDPHELATAIDNRTNWSMRGA